MTTKTYRLRASDIERKWRVLDASGRPLGRIASDAARLLLGKHKPTYEPHLAMGDHVIVINAGEVILTGNKASQKVYYRHSGHPGNLHERSFAQQMERDPRKVIETAVKGMLPHNPRGRELFRHLKVYAGSEHPHEAQVNAGTGARARRRANAEARAAAAPAPAIEVEESVVEEPMVEAPVAEAPAADEPMVEEPVAEAPAADEPMVEEPVAEAPAADEPMVEEPVAEAPAADEPMVEEPVAEAPAADEPMVEAPAETVEEAVSEASPERLTGALSRYRRDELDAEAERLGITIESEWRKSDVSDAITAYYEANPLDEEE